MEIGNNFREKLQNRLKNLQVTEDEEHGNIDDIWNSLKRILQETTAEVCGNKDRKEKKPWFNTECQDMIKKRKLLKTEWLHNKNEQSRVQYNTQVRETTKTLRRKKRA